MRYRNAMADNKDISDLLGQPLRAELPAVVGGQVW